MTLNHEKPNWLLGLINSLPNIDKIYLYKKDLFKEKYLLFINNFESISLKLLSNDIADVYKNIDKCNPNKKINCKSLIVFHDIADDMLSNKKLNPIVTQLFIRERKLNIYVLFVTHPVSNTID